MNNAITRDQIEEKVKSIIIDIVPELASSRAQMSLETHLTQTLALDSLALAELFMAIEDSFKLHISEKEAIKIQTLRALVDFIEHDRKS